MAPGVDIVPHKRFMIDNDRSSFEIAAALRSKSRETRGIIRLRIDSKKVKGMSFQDCTRACTAALCAITICAPALCREPKPQNFILLVPHSMPAAIVDPMIAPTLARLRAEGVYFINSHTANPAQAETGTFVLNVRSLTRAAATNHSTALVEEFEDAPYAWSREVSEGKHQVNLDKVLREVLPQFKAAGRPFLLVYRLGQPQAVPQTVEDSDSTENIEEPPAAFLEVLAVNDTLAALEGGLKSLGLYDSTNIVVAAEHGSSTVWKDSDTSVSLALAGDKRPRDKLPPGFLAIDIVDALQKVDGGLSLYDTDNGNKLVAYTSGHFPEYGNAVIAVDPADPFATVEARGGYDLIHLPASLPKKEARRRAQLIVNALLDQDYLGGLFLDEARVGRMRGALSIEHLGWKGTSTKRPTIVVNFVSVSTGCDRPMLCTLVIADTPLEDGEQIQGSLNRAETWNFIAARGPAFGDRFVDDTPASNADVVMTLAYLMHIDLGVEFNRHARVLTESLIDYDDTRAPRKRQKTFSSKASATGEVTESRMQIVDRVKYFDAGGLGGWTVGIPERLGPVEWRPWRWDWPRPNGFSINITP